MTKINLMLNHISKEKFNHDFLTNISQEHFCDFLDILKNKGEITYQEYSYTIDIKNLNSILNTIRFIYDFTQLFPIYDLDDGCPVIRPFDVIYEISNIFDIILKLIQQPGFISIIINTENIKEIKEVKQN